MKIHSRFVSLEFPSSSFSSSPLNTQCLPSYHRRKIVVLISCVMPNYAVLFVVTLPTRIKYFWIGGRTNRESNIKRFDSLSGASIPNLCRFSFGSQWLVACLGDGVCLCEWFFRYFEQNNSTCDLFAYCFVCECFGFSSPTQSVSQQATMRVAQGLNSYNFHAKSLELANSLRPIYPLSRVSCTGVAVVVVPRTCCLVSLLLHFWTL